MTRVERLIGVAILALAVLLPLLALVPLGWAWLWERGYALYWLGGALLSSILAFGVWVVTIGRLKDRLGKSGPASEQAGHQVAVNSSPRTTRSAPRVLPGTTATHTNAAMPTSRYQTPGAQ